MIEMLPFASINVFEIYFSKKKIVFNYFFILNLILKLIKSFNNNMDRLEGTINNKINLVEC